MKYWQPINDWYKDPAQADIRNGVTVGAAVVAQALPLVSAGLALYGGYAVIRDYASEREDATTPESIAPPLETTTNEPLWQEPAADPDLDQQVVKDVTAERQQHLADAAQVVSAGGAVDNFAELGTGLNEAGGLLSVAVAAKAAGAIWVDVYDAAKDLITGKDAAPEQVVPEQVAPNHDAPRVDTQLAQPEQPNHVPAEQIPEKPEWQATFEEQATEQRTLLETRQEEARLALADQQAADKTTPENDKELERANAAQQQALERDLLEKSLARTYDRLEQFHEKRTDVTREYERDL